MHRHFGRFSVWSVVVFAVLAAAPGAGEPLVVDPCGGFAGTSGGEVVTLPHLDVCEADAVAHYTDRSLVLDLRVEVAGDLGDLRGASYRVGWTSADGCPQYVEVRDPQTAPMALFAYGCGADHDASLSGVSPDECATLPAGDEEPVCYGEAAQWLVLPDGAVTIDGSTLAVSLPLHELLADPDVAGFAPGAVLGTLAVTTHVRVDGYNHHQRPTSVGLAGTTYTVSPTDEAAGGSLTIPQPPEDWHPPTT